MADTEIWQLITNMILSRLLMAEGPESLPSQPSPCPFTENMQEAFDMYDGDS